MKLIIAGSRDQSVTDEELTALLNQFNLKPTTVVSGMATGIDTCGWTFAVRRNIPVMSFYANWRGFGKAAGPIRNREMGEYADALLLIWDGKSYGSANMRSIMRSLGKPTYEAIIK